MRFSFAAALAMATSVLAQTEGFNPIFTPLKNEVIPAGSTYEITWEAPAAWTSAVVKISLIGGADPASLVPVADIASGIANSDNSYSWTVDASLGEAATYGIVIALESDPTVFQYSNPFSIEAGAEAPAPSASASASAGAVTTITTATGVATVTLTSCPPEEPSTTSTPIITSSAAPNTTISTSSVVISTPTWNTTTLVTLPPPATTAIVVPPPAPTVPAPVPVPSPSDVQAGAARYVSGSFALAGGFAVAMLL